MSPLTGEPLVNLIPLLWTIEITGEYPSKVWVHLLNQPVVPVFVFFPILSISAEIAAPTAQYGPHTVRITHFILTTGFAKTKVVTLMGDLEDNQMRITSVSISQSTLTSDAPPLWNLRHNSGSEAFSFEQLQMVQSSYAVRISAIKTVSGVARIVSTVDL